MVDLSRDVLEKLGRAKAHLKDLDRAVKTISEHRAHPLLVYDDPDTGHRQVRYDGDPEAVPPLVSILLGDCVHNLRSAMEYFASQAIGGATEDSGFPVWATGRPNTRALETHIEKKIGGPIGRPTPRKLINAMRALQPHEGGKGETLWVVDYLDRIDKHRFLVTTWWRYHSFIIDGMATLRANPDLLAHIGQQPSDVPEMLIRLVSAERGPIQRGDVLFSAPPDVFESHQRLEFAIEIAFGEPSPLEGEPVIPTLGRLINEVEQTLLDLATSL